MGLFDIFRVGEIKIENERLLKEVDELKGENDRFRTLMSEIHNRDYMEIAEMTTSLRKESSDIVLHIKKLNDEVCSAKETIDSLNTEITSLREQKDSVDSKFRNAEFKLSKLTTQAKGIQKMLKTYSTLTDKQLEIYFDSATLQFLDSFAPTVTLKMHSDDMKDLKKVSNDTRSSLNSVLKSYESRYTTKANAAIYKLMVIALQSELQNILYNMKFDKLEVSLEYVNNILRKYLEIAGEGNQSIAPTLVRFIGEIEDLFITLVRTEYEYYVRKEQAKEEQQRLREIMRQEAEERKILEQQRKQIEAEESKYTLEIDKLSEQLISVNDTDEKHTQLLQRIAELQSQLSDVQHKKEDIINLQNGKAGYVYIISNLGSFGDKVFKVGMTRRLDPQDRVNELGDASVPFGFDVHSFIFSDDAVGLESKLHAHLDSRRMNKINLRKEFFQVEVDQLEQLVFSIDPTAEFNRTMLAEQFRQSTSLDNTFVDDNCGEIGA